MHPPGADDVEPGAAGGHAPDVNVHVGTHKTGTTALQEFLALNDELLLAKSGILYPRAGRNLVKHYHHAYFRTPLTEERCIDRTLLGELSEEAAARRAARILPSSEFLSRHTIGEEELRQLRAAFPGSRFTITIYLRRQDRFLESTYAERVRRGLIAAPAGLPDTELQLDYYEFVSKFADVFGRESINLRIYERACRAGLPRDFLEAHGVEWNSRFVVPEVPRNERLSWAYLALLRHANSSPVARRIATHPFARRAAQFLYRALPALMDRPRPLTPAARRDLLAIHDASNRRLAEQFLGNSQLFPDKSRSLEPDA